MLIAEIPLSPFPRMLSVVMLLSERSGPIRRGSSDNGATRSRTGLMPGMPVAHGA
jgi:hypothetical protein